MLKKDGRLVYATCSLFRQENENQVKAFLATHPDWQLDNEFHVRPDMTQFDGFYAAALVRSKAAALVRSKATCTNQVRSE